MRSLAVSAALAASALIGSAPLASALEYPIGEPKLEGGMEVAAVYLQPIEMDPPGMMRAAADSDIHLEADIRATGDNPNGFAEGDWMPYLAVRYELIRLDSGEVLKGELMPMVADDGPHYGDNLKLPGMGKYRLVLEVTPPGADPRAMFGRHVDKETGVAPWFEPFKAEYEFTFAGTGKKGGY
ncbi:MAG: iron transporter [Pseudomonadota bacterium]